MMAKARAKPAVKKIRLKAFGTINLREEGRLIARNEEFEIDEKRGRLLIEKGWAYEVTAAAPAKKEQEHGTDD